MPRTRRTFGESGYMHIYLRGNGKQVIFEQRDDYIYYLHLLRRFSAATSVIICTFCLMENHVHLIIFDPEHKISQMMRLLGTTYARYFNEKYQHVGHLYQDRFSSIAIESEEYLLTVFRYVLNNPRKTGIPAAAYPWSSYNRYGKTASFVDTSVFVELIGTQEEYEAIYRR